MPIQPIPSVSLNQTDLHSLQEISKEQIKNKPKRSRTYSINASYEITPAFATELRNIATANKRTYPNYQRNPFQSG